jgi:crotonobetainyl-CoA hydratase
MRLNLEKPIIAAVNGFALGGGFETALCCDILLATETARFALPEVKVGFFAAAGGIQRLSREIGRKQAIAMILTGRQVDADEGHRLGFVNEVLPPDRLMERAMEVAREIVSVSPSSIRASLRVMRAMDDLDNLRASLLYSRHTMAELRETEDFREGVTAFAEKRKPEWKNQ